MQPSILYRKTITGIACVSRRCNALDAKSVPSLLRRTSFVHPVYKTISSGIKSPQKWKSQLLTNETDGFYLTDIEIKTESSLLIMNPTY